MFNVYQTVTEDGWEFYFSPIKYAIRIPIKTIPIPITVPISSLKLLPFPWESHGNPMEMGKIVRCLPAKKISSVSQALATARIVPRICQVSPRQCTQSALDFIQIGSLSAELGTYSNARTPSKRAN